MSNSTSNAVFNKNYASSSAAAVANDDNDDAWFSRKNAEAIGLQLGAPAQVRPGFAQPSAPSAHHNTKWNNAYEGTPVRDLSLSPSMSADRMRWDRITTRDANCAPPEDRRNISSVSGLDNVDTRLAGSTYPGRALGNGSDWRSGPAAPFCGAGNEIPRHNPSNVKPSTSAPSGAKTSNPARLPIPSSNSKPGSSRAIPVPVPALPNTSRPSGPKPSQCTSRPTTSNPTLSGNTNSNNEVVPPAGFVGIGSRLVQLCPANVETDREIQSFSITARGDHTTLYFTDGSSCAIPPDAPLEDMTRRGKAYWDEKRKKDAAAAVVSAANSGAVSDAQCRPTVSGAATTSGASTAITNGIANAVSAIGNSVHDLIERTMHTGAPNSNGVTTTTATGSSNGVTQQTDMSVISQEQQVASRLATTIGNNAHATNIPAIVVPPIPATSSNPTTRGAVLPVVIPPLAPTHHPTTSAPPHATTSAPPHTVPGVTHGPIGEPMCGVPTNPSTAIPVDGIPPPPGGQLLYTVPVGAGAAAIIRPCCTLPWILSVILALFVLGAIIAAFMGLAHAKKQGKEISVWSSAPNPYATIVTTPDGSTAANAAVAAAALQQQQQQQHAVAQLAGNAVYRQSLPPVPLTASGSIPLTASRLVTPTAAATGFSSIPAVSQAQNILTQSGGLLNSGLVSPPPVLPRSAIF